MAVVLKDGTVRVFLREVLPGEPALSIRAGLPPGGPHAGPITVTASAMMQPGAWNVLAGSSEAFLARADAGELTLQWTFPGGAKQQKSIVLEQRPLRFLLTPEKPSQESTP